MNLESSGRSRMTISGLDTTSRRRAESPLAEAMDALADLVYVLDANGRFLYWNQAVAACTGYSDDEIAEMNPLDFFAEEERPRVRESLQRTWARGEERLEVCVRTKDGKRVPYEFTGSLLHDEQGTPVALCGAGRNISERKQYEDALRDSERRFRTLFEASRDAMMVLGEQGRFIKGNHAAVALFGCRDEEEFRRCSPAELSPTHQPDGRPSDVAAREMVQKAVAQGAHSFEWTHRRLDGTEFDASVLLTRMELDNRLQVHATVRDVSAEKEVKRALQANEQRLRTITDSALDAIVMIDSQGQIIHWNPSATTMFGYLTEDVLGRNPHDFLTPPNLREAAARGLDAFVKSGNGPAIGQIVELTALRSNGSEFPIEVTVSPVQTDEGWSAVAVIRDISDRKQLEESLRSQTRELRAKVRELSCLDGASAVFEESDLPPLEMVGRVLELLSEVAPDSAAQGARISYHDDVFCTPEVADSSERMHAPLVVDGIRVGELEVFLESDADDADGQSALRTKHSLLEQLAARLGRALERHLRHEEVKSLNQKIELLLSATRTRFLLTDEDCIVHYADPETQRLYGSVTNQKCSRYLFLAGGGCHGCPRTNPAGRERTVVSHFTFPLERDRVFQQTSAPVRTSSGEKMYATVLVDVTDYKAMEAKLNQAKKLEAVGQLAAGIAHEINTPTQFVGDNARFLKESFSDLERILDKLDRLLATAQDGANVGLLEDIRASMDEMDVNFLRGEIPASIDQTLEGVGQIGRIVRAMKEFSHPGVDEKQPIDLNRAIENTLTVSRGEWKHVAELRTDFDPKLPMVPCFPGDLNQALLNIVVNGAHAIDEKNAGVGTLTVRTRHAGSSAEIQISDTGAGIPEDVRPRIFDHFFTTKEVGKGTGQGLTIAHTVIVEKHGGSLDFRSKVGRGTTFTIRLPLEDGCITDGTATVAKVST